MYRELSAEEYLLYVSSECKSIRDIYICKVCLCINLGCVCLLCCLLGKQGFVQVDVIISVVSLPRQSPDFLLSLAFQVMN